MRKINKNENKWTWMIETFNINNIAIDYNQIYSVSLYKPLQYEKAEKKIKNEIWNTSEIWNSANTSPGTKSHFFHNFHELL